MANSTDFKNIYNMLDSLQRGDLWLYTSQILKAYVKRLMSAGIDVNGRRFKPYSASYIKFRTKHGRGSRVNLQFTSEMMLNIVSRATGDGFEVFIAGAFNNKKAEWVSEDRVFLDWGNLTTARLDKAMNDYFKLRGWND